MQEKGNTTLTISFDGLSTLLTIIFVVLKLCHVIDWHWALVLLPSIITWGLTLIILAVFAIIYLINWIQYKRS